jgi:hypothetical protein
MQVANVSPKARHYFSNASPKARHYFSNASQNVMFHSQDALQFSSSCVLHILFFVDNLYTCLIGVSRIFILQGLQKLTDEIMPYRCWQNNDIFLFFAI